MASAINRRTFLRISGTTVIGAAAVSAGLMNLPGKVWANDRGVIPDRVVPSFCELCFWKCGVLAYVKDEKVYKLEGNPKHPLSNGKLCPRGTGGIGALYDPDRLKRPLIRTKVNGEDKWREVSWDEALTYTATRLSEVKAKYGAQSIALFSHGHGGAFFKTLVKALGSSTIVAPSNDQCRGPRESGFELTYGDVVGSVENVDTPHSKCIAYLGTHLGENMHNTAVQDVSAASARGCTFITVDPRFSIIASKSKYWLPIKPGTDTALLLAWAHVLIEENLFDKDFVEQNVVGFEQFKEHVKDRTPEWAYLETGLEPSVIRETARELAKNAPAAFVHPGRHVVWYGNDTQRSRAVAIVNGLLGNWGKKGGFYFPQSLNVPGYPGSKALPHADSYKPRLEFPLATAPCAFDVAQASMKDGDDEARIHAWMVYGCNVPLTLPNTAKTIEAMKQLDFVVAVDTMPSEVTGYADVVLPENTYLERYDDLESTPYRVPYVALRQPAVASLYDSKPGWWIAKSLGEKLGLGEYFPWKDAEDYLSKRVEKGNLSFTQLKQDGVILGAPAAIYEAGPLTLKTPSKKVEFFSQKMADAGLPPMPDYEPPEEPPAGYFRLLFGRSPVHTFSRTTNNPRLLELVPENELWINAEMARVLGLKPGVKVMIENQDSVQTGPITLKVTERIRQDCVYMVHGFGREDARLTRGYKRGASDSRLVTRVKRDPVMGGTGMNVNFVSISRWKEA